MGTFVPGLVPAASRKIGGMEISITDAVAGVGCAVLSGEGGAGAPLAEVATEIEAHVGAAVEVLGLLHVDGDGRVVAEPSAARCDDGRLSLDNVG